MCLTLAFAAALLAQSTPVAPPPDALSLLNDVAERYAQATSYHIEAIEESTFSNELSRNWQKSLLTSIVAPGGRYRYEGRSGGGAAILVSDGTTGWKYHLNEHLYTKSAASESPSARRIISQEEFPVQQARHLITELRSFASRLKSATFLADEKVMVNGRSIECYVVRFTDDDFKTKRPDGEKTEETIWIDKSRKVIVKRASRSDSYAIVAGSGVHIPMLAETATVYPVVELDQKQLDATFAFSPPPEAKLVETFPDRLARASQAQVAELVGQPAPELQLKRSDGKATTLSALRGKPVFIDFWATSCLPCIELMPDLKKLYNETVSRGLVWISIDGDQDPDVATKFVASERLPWANYHDTDGQLGKAFNRELIPLGVLIGTDGIIKFYGAGYDITELRAAVAKLGPEFSAIAPGKSKQ